MDQRFYDSLTNEVTYKVLTLNLSKIFEENAYSQLGVLKNINRQENN